MEDRDVGSFHTTVTFSSYIPHGVCSSSPAGVRTCIGRSLRAGPEPHHVGGGVSWSRRCTYTVDDQVLWVESYRVQSARDSRGCRPHHLMKLLIGRCYLQQEQMMNDPHEGSSDPVGSLESCSRSHHLLQGST